MVHGLHVEAIINGTRHAGHLPRGQAPVVFGIE
jgi:hypothetical protein